MATLSDLISRADTFDPSTAWLLKHLARQLPSDAKVLKTKAEVLTDPVPDFRKVPGGLIKVGVLTIGNAHGNGYLNHLTGKWSEIKGQVMEALLSGEEPDIRVKDTIAKKAPAKATTPKSIKTKTPKAEESDDYLVCECCGKRVSYEEGLVRVGGKRICSKCAHAKHGHVNKPIKNASEN